MPPICVGEILGFHEKRLETLLGSRDNCGVVTEEQAA